jgi:hypothetical protein
MPSQPEQAGHYQQLVDNFASQQRAPEEALYLLVAPYARCLAEHPLSVTSLTDALGKPAVVRVDFSELVQAPHFWPALIRLAKPGEASTIHTALSATYAAREATANRHYVCGWLLSHQPAEHIARHISQHCHVLHQPPPHGPSAWFEPIRLVLLRQTMSNAAQLLGPIRAWLHPDGCGSCTLVERQPLTGELRVPETARAAQHIAPQIIQLLSAWRQLNSVQQTYAPWRFKGPSGLPEHAPAHAMKLILKAFKQGLRERADIQCMCLHMAMIHPLLLQHSTIQRDVARAAAGEQRLASRFASYDDYVWSQIVAALPPARSYS